MFGLIIEIKKNIRNEDAIKALEKKYTSIENLQKAIDLRNDPELIDDYEVWKALLKGADYSESIRLEDKGLLSLMTPKRMELLDYLKTRHPKSILGLAKGLKRDYKNVYEDLRILGKYGVVEKKVDGRNNIPECRIKEIVVKLEA